MQLTEGTVTRRGPDLNGVCSLLRSSARSLTILSVGIRDLLTIGSPVDDEPRRRRAVRGAVSIPLGAVAWMLAAMVALMIARGAFYGLVDAGPYDNSWGGPTLAGAWLTHFTISVPITIAALAAMTGIARLHGRLTRWVRGQSLGWWPLPVVLVICLAAVVFFVAWLQQI